MVITDEDRVETLRNLNAELRSYAAKLEWMLERRNQFLQALCDPDALGYAVNEEVRRHASRLLHHGWD